MATTSLNPGVGPTNADIATAVAAPSAATIAAAVAAPSAATIASAVAAPSAATIATAVAAAVPTTAGITSIVQANAGSPFGGTITNLGMVTANSVNTTTITGLSGYKYLKFHCIGNSTGASWAWMVRFNGDTTTANYFSNMATNGINVGGNGNFGGSAEMRLCNNSVANNPSSVLLEIPDSNSGALKIVTARGFTNVAGQSWMVNEAVGTYNSTSAISSVTFFTSNGSTWDNGCRIFVMGAN